MSANAEKQHLNLGYECANLRPITLERWVSEIKRQVSAKSDMAEAAPELKF
jgi:hypothetical protein